MRFLTGAIGCALSLLLATPLAAAGVPPVGPPLPVPRAAGEIAIDGKLDDAAWQQAAVLDTFFETYPADAVYNDATGSEDLSPDFFYYTAAQITDDGWTTEMRIPLSSLRYPEQAENRWGILQRVDRLVFMKISYASYAFLR